MVATREPAVAGSFYPADPQVLQAQLDELFAGVSTLPPPPKAMIVPHAGYIYSGPVAASGYASLAPIAGQIERVVLLASRGLLRRRGTRRQCIQNATGQDRAGPGVHR